MLPAPTTFAFDGKNAIGHADGDFMRYTDAAGTKTPAPITCTLRKRANLTLASKMNPMIHSSWNTAAVTRWSMNIPLRDRALPLLIRIHYIGNVRVRAMNHVYRVASGCE